MWSLYALAPLLLMGFALVHFFKRGSGNYIWIFIIIFLGPLGAIVYLVVEALPELRSSSAASNWAAKRKRAKELEAVVLDNPSAGNYEELADVYLQDGNYARARDCFDRALAARTDLPDPFYGRAQCALYLRDVPAAVPDLEKVIALDRKHDYNRGLGLLAFCYGETGQPARAEQLYREALSTSTLSETQFHFAQFLASQGRYDEAREWAERIVRKRDTLSGPLRRAEAGWVQQAKALLKQLSSPATSKP